MVCESCGEKPKNTAKDFTKAVIEINNPEALVLLRKVVIPASMGDETQVPASVGLYRNVILQYQANDHLYLYSSDGIPTDITAKLPQEILDNIAELEHDVDDLQQQIDDLKNSPDVVDIVATYADLQAYDTSHLGDKDIIRVLTDETHDGASSYYRWNKQTETWTYVGSIQTAANTIFYANLSETGNMRHIYKNSDMTGTVSVQELLDANEDGQVILRMSSAQTPENFNDAYLQNTYVGVDDYQFLFLDNRNYYEYDGTATTDTSYYYSKSTIQLALTAGNNITITGNTISATDTTYTNFTGATASTDGAQGLVPGPLAGDEDKFLKADGTWDTNSATFYTGEDVSSLKVYEASRANEIYGDAFYNDGLVTQYGATHSLRGDINVPLNEDTSASHGIFVGTGWYPKYADSVADWLVDGVISIGYNSDARARYQQGGSIARTWSPYFISIGHSAGRGFSNPTSLFGTTFIGSGTYSAVPNSDANRDASVAVGFGSVTSRIDEFSIGAGSAKPNTIYTARYLANVKAGSLDTDAVNVEQLNGRVKTNAGAPTTATVGTVGQLLEDTTNGKLYQCTAVTPGTDPDPDTYTWEEVGGSAGPTVVQTTGTSTTDVMSQNATTSMVFADPSGKTKVRIGNGYTSATGLNSVAVGANAKGANNSAVALGYGADAGASSSVAIGRGAKTTTTGEFNIGSSGNWGYNNTNYRLLTGLYDGQSLHDAATVAQGNTLATSAPTTSTVGVLGQLYTDTANMHTYQCTAIDTTDPDNPSYTWTQRW